MSYCPNCGTKMEATDRFCPTCGHSSATLPASSVPPAQLPVPPTATVAPTSTTAHTRKGRRLGLLVGGGCLTLLLGAGALVALVVYLGGGATDAAREHLECLIRGDVATAYQKASPAFHATISLDAYQALVNARPLLQQTKNVSIPDRKVENDIATVTAQLTDSGGALRSVPMRLRKEGGAWLVIAIDLSGIPAQQGPPTKSETTSSTEGLKPVGPGDRSRSVGTVVIGSGRTESGALIKPGKVVSSATEMLSADITLLNHPPGGAVRVWIEHIASGRQTAPVSATIEGEGSGNLPFDLHLGEEKLSPGKYRLVIVLDEDMRFVREFEVK